MKAILFGSIGTLIETSDLQREAFNQAFKEAVKNQQEWHENEQQILEELRSFLVTAIPKEDLSLRYK